MNRIRYLIDAIKMAMNPSTASLHFDDDKKRLLMFGVTMQINQPHTFKFCYRNNNIVIVHTSDQFSIQMNRDINFKKNEEVVLKVNMFLGSEPMDMLGFNLTNKNYTDVLNFLDKIGTYAQYFKVSLLEQPLKEDTIDDLENFVDYQRDMIISFLTHK